MGNQVCTALLNQHVGSKPSLSQTFQQRYETAKHVERKVIGCVTYTVIPTSQNNKNGPNGPLYIHPDKTVYYLKPDGSLRSTNIKIKTGT